MFDQAVGVGVHFGLHRLCVVFIGRFKATEAPPSRTRPILIEELVKPFSLMFALTVGLFHEV
jgi:hypothetical protein